MSDEVKDREWPTHCEHCGTELTTGVVDVIGAPDNEWAQGRPPLEVIAQDYCPNPGCPAKDSDAAPPAVDHEHLDRDSPVAEADRPGSMGGDNGGG